MIVPVMAISNLVLTQQIYSEETNGAHAHYREQVPLRLTVACEQQTHFRSSLLSLLLFAGQVDRRLITLFKPFFRGKEIQSCEMSIFFKNFGPYSKLRTTNSPIEWRKQIQSYNNRALLGKQDQRKLLRKFLNLVPTSYVSRSQRLRSSIITYATKIALAL